MVVATLAQAHNAILKQRGRLFVGDLLEQIDANLCEPETQSEARTGKKLEQASQLPGLEKPPELAVDTMFLSTILDSLFLGAAPRMEWNAVLPTSSVEIGFRSIYRFDSRSCLG
jgi:hypothetical protein